MTDFEKTYQNYNPRQTALDEARALLTAAARAAHGAFCDLIDPGAFGLVALGNGLFFGVAGLSRCKHRYCGIAQYQRKRQQQRCGSFTSFHNDSPYFQSATMLLWRKYTSSGVIFQYFLCKSTNL